MSTRDDNISPLGDNQGAIDGASFAARVHEAASRLGYKPADLHRKTGFSRQTISTWWNGRKIPDGPNLLAFAAALGVDGGWLLFGVPSSARQLIDHVAKLLENDAEEEATKLITALQKVAVDPDVPINMQAQADKLLEYLGDEDAKRRRLNRDKVIAKAYENIMDLVGAAVQQFEEEHDMNLGRNARLRLATFCQSLLAQQIDSFTPELVRFSVYEVLVALLVEGDQTLHDRRPSYRPG